MADRPIYFIPGLGATRVCFEKTTVPIGWEMHYIDWIEVENEEESLDQYIARLSKQVKHKDPVFVGLSFGGIMAMELSKKYNAPFSILLSSFRDSGDLALSLRLLLNSKAYRLIPNIEMNAIRKLVRKAYSRASNISTEKLIEMMGKETPMFLRWSCAQIDEYKFDQENTPPLYPIIGDNDRLVNIWEDHEVRIVEKGTHIAVYAHAEEVNHHIAEILKSNV